MSRCLSGYTCVVFIENTTLGGFAREVKAHLRLALGCGPGRGDVCLNEQAGPLLVLANTDVSVDGVSDASYNSIVENQVDSHIQKNCIDRSDSIPLTSEFAAA